MILPLGTIMQWSDQGITCHPSDHSRSELSVSTERIGHSERMANGRLRKYHIADKRTWSTSWDMLPAPSNMTADGKAGGKEIEKFFMDIKGEFTMRIINKDSNLNEEVRVVFKDFSKSIVKRGAYDMWNLNVSLEEC